jgi:hypothetical protein
MISTYELGVPALSPNSPDIRVGTFHAFAETSVISLQKFSPCRMCVFMQKWQSSSLTCVLRAFKYLSQSCTHDSRHILRDYMQYGQEWLMHSCAACLLASAAWMPLLANSTHSIYSRKFHHHVVSTPLTVFIVFCPATIQFELDILFFLSTIEPRCKLDTITHG